MVEWVAEPRCLEHQPPLTVSCVYVGLTSLGFLGMLVRALRSITCGWLERCAYAAILLACSYPFLIGVVDGVRVVIISGLR